MDTFSEPFTVSTWNQLANETVLNRTVRSLEENGFSVSVVNTREQAKALVLALLPKGSEVMTMTSKTLKQSGIDSAINESGDYDALHPKVIKMNRQTQSKEIVYLRSAPDYAIGSVHAITADGKVMIASGTGSQLPAYVYGSKKVIWVVGTQKIVEDLSDGFKRLDEYVVPLESQRINEAYNITSGSFISRLVIYYRERINDRIHLVLVKEQLGF